MSSHDVIIGNVKMPRMPVQKTGKSNHAESYVNFNRVTPLWNIENIDKLFSSTKKRFQNILKRHKMH